jgi:hypothetical protein
LLSPFKATSSAPYIPHFVYCRCVCADGIMVNAAIDVAKIATANIIANKATHRI